jgi:hypothetical protein
MVCISLLKSLCTDAPIIDGNRKKIKIVNPLKRFETPIGEFTIWEEPVVAVIKSNIPAVAADINSDNRKKIDK